MICTLTEPKQSTDVLQAGHEADHCLAKSRQLPCLFLLAVMAHVVHPPCNYPLHFTLSDYVQSHSGSTELLQLLSRFGVCSSRDTFQRMKTKVVAARKDDGLQKEVATGAFSVTSIDNIDRGAPNQRITQAQQTRGFHSTGVLVTPKPAYPARSPLQINQLNLSYRWLQLVFSLYHSRCAA